MINTHELEPKVLSLGMRSEMETIKEYNSHEYIPERGLSTMVAYRTPNGPDAKALKTRIVTLQGCKLQDSSTPKAIFDDRTKIIRVIFDKSKIIPLSDKGYIAFEVSGNYGFRQLLKFPWTIDKMPLEVKNEWINIQKESEEPITWNTGDVLVAKISMILPDEIKNNHIWYHVINPTIEFVGQGSNLYKIPTDTELLYEKTYDIMYNCCETIDQLEEKSIKVKFKDAGPDEQPQEMRISFVPAVRQITAVLENCTESYTLGSSDTALARLSLLNKCKDIYATACVKINISSEIDTNDENRLITCDEEIVEVKTNQTKEVFIRINSQRLKQLPDNDVKISITAEGSDKYTKSEFSDSFKLKV